MTEWEVVGVIVVIVGLFFTVSTPVMKLISCITKLTATVENLQKDVAYVTSRNTDAHRRLWAKSEEHDREIQDHSNRIERLEGRVDSYHGK